MNNDLCRSVGFHAPPQNLETPSVSSLTMADWDPPPISSAMEADLSQAFLHIQNHWSEQSILESALTWLMSSPATMTETNSGDNNSMIIRELIGKLSSFGNNRTCELLPSTYSSPELNFPARAIPNTTMAPDISADVGFASLGNRRTPISINEKMPRVESVPSIVAVRSRDESTVSQRISGGFCRKRKCLTKGKAKESEVGVFTSTNPKKDGETYMNDRDPKKSKAKDKNTKEKSSGKEEESDDVKPPEPPKDFIHVRARRGQATDSHSLAERVRREKISERMKLLQSIVPGCNKVTGKALMLDEIINYVQSLQRQVEFLSMKIASVNTNPDITMDSLLPRNISEGNNYSSQSQIFQYDSSATQLLGNRFDHAALIPMHVPPPPPQCSQNAPQYPMPFCEDDLQAIVQMGFGHSQNSQGKSRTINEKKS